MKDVLNELIDVFICHSKLTQVYTDKNEAIKNQEFEKAIELRDLERELIARLPTIEAFEIMKDKLNKQTK